MKGRYWAPLEERLWAKVESEGDCWVWTGAKDTCGYGRIWSGGRNQGTHQVAYALENGPVPAGLELDHLCRNRACLRPEHLEAVTHAENMRRGLALARRVEQMRAQETCKASHPLSGDNLYIEVTPLGSSKRRCRTCRRDANRRAQQKIKERVTA